MKINKESVIYQILFQPRKGQLFSLITYVFILAAIIWGIVSLAGCQRYPDNLITPKSKVMFKSALSGLKTADSIATCQAVVDQDTFDLNVFYDNGNPYSESFEIGEGNHSLNHFIIFNQNGDEIGAAPLGGSSYAYLVDNDTLPKPFTVNYATVTEVPVTVLYMTTEDYDLTNFGYGYFGINPAYIRTVNFFGQKGTADSLLYHYANRQTSDYMKAYDPPQTIMHLFYWVQVLHKVDNGQWHEVKWYNLPWGSDGRIYNIQYIDYSNHTDSTEFRFEMHAWFPNINRMAYVIRVSSTGLNPWSIYTCDADGILSDSDGMTTIALAPDSTWFPSVDYFFQYDY